MSRRQDGFTLIELLVALAIAGILLGVALPSLLASIDGRRAASVGSNFVQDASWARSEAIGGAQSAGITLMPDCSWQVMINGVNVPDHSMTHAQVTGYASGIACTGVPPSGLVLQFDSMGMVAAPPGQTAGATNWVGFASPMGASGSSSVEIFGSGVILWDPQNAS